MTIKTIGDLLRLLGELVLVVLLGEERQPEQRVGRHRPLEGGHGRLVPADWSPLPVEVRRQIAPTFYTGRSA